MLADNQRFAVVDLPVTTPVLLVDGQRSASNSKPIALALTVHKGIQVEMAAADYLSAPKRPLADFAMICVSNCSKIERSGVEALEKYVAGGGGVLFVTGPLTRGDTVNQDLYRNGKGLFPLPLGEPAPLVGDPLDNTPDVQSEEHYLFRNMDHRVENISKIFVKQYFAVSADWKAEKDPSVGVIMRLRNRAPLLVEKSFGRGRVLAFLSTTSDRWNNWFNNNETASFFGFVVEMVPYLSHRFGTGAGLLVGEPKTMSFSSPPFEPAVRFSGPGEAATATLNGDASGKDQQTVTYTKTELAGFYKALLEQPSHKTESRNFAVNVDANEGDLRGLSGSDLACA